MKKHEATKQCYFVAHDPSVHYGELEAGQEVVTGQANLEIFNNEEEYIDRLNELGIELPLEEDIDLQETNA